MLRTLIHLRDKQLDAFVRSEFAKWGKVIKSLNLKVD